jgi:hypothetical protein
MLEPQLLDGSDELVLMLWLNNLATGREVGSWHDLSSLTQASNIADGVYQLLQDALLHDVHEAQLHDVA